MGSTESHIQFSFLSQLSSDANGNVVAERFFAEPTSTGTVLLLFQKTRFIGHLLLKMLPKMVSLSHSLFLSLSLILPHSRLSCQRIISPSSSSFCSVYSMCSATSINHSTSTCMCLLPGSETQRLRFDIRQP